MAKISYEIVKTEIENKNWKLLSKNYVNLKTVLEVQCPEGHECSISFETFRKDKETCPICEQNKYYNIKKNISIKKDGYRILALDQATITSGWAIFDETELIVYGTHTSDGDRNTERIAKTKQWFASLIQLYQPDEIILEDIQLQNINGTENVLVYKKLAHLQGVLKNYCYEQNLKYKVVAPATWRAYSEIKGKTRADKKRNAQLKVKRFFDVSVSQDEADAILIARWGAAQHKKNEIITF